MSDKTLIKPGSHALLSASSAERWATCPGSVALSRDVPRGSSRYAAEGTVAHHVAAVCLMRQEEPRAWLGDTVEADGQLFVVDQDMVSAVEDYVNYILIVTKPGDQIRIEQSFTPALQKLHPSFGGNTDFVRYSPLEALLEVVDYKHGAGVAVEAENNMQLKYYALGAVLANPTWKPARIKLTIVQPRCDHPQGRIRSFEFPAEDLQAFADELVEAAKRTEEFGAALVPSAKACRFCPANAANKCPAIQQKTQALMKKDFLPVDPTNYSMEQIAEFLDMAPIVEARISALREFAYQRACAGEKIPGHKLVEKRATRHWNDPAAAEMILRSTAHRDAVFTEPQLKSPAQVEKIMGKKAFKDFVGELVDKRSSGLTLVSDKDNRAEATSNRALLEDFKAVE
jgi:hypothetical protein